MLNISGYIFMIVIGALCGMMAFINLLQTGAPIMGVVMFGCGAMLVGGWALLCEEYNNE